MNSYDAAFFRATLPGKVLYMFSMNTICFLIKLFFLNQRLIEYPDKGIKKPSGPGI